MELNELATFIAIAEKNSFSVAAESLFLTQPAVSKRLASLEAELGSKLFDRIGRKITLTETGKVLLPRARAILSDADDIKRLALSISDTVSGTLLMGTSHHIGLHRLPPFLESYTRCYPDVNLDIRFLDSEAACRQVETGQLEAAIVTLPSQPAEQLETRKIWTDALVFVVGKQHPVAAIDRPSIEQLLDYPAVLPGPTTFTRAILNRYIARNNLKLNIGMSTNYLETLKMLVQTGQGWSLLPQSMVDASLSTVALPLALSRDLGIVTHTHRTLSNAARALIDALMSEQN